MLLESFFSPPQSLVVTYVILTWERARKLHPAWFRRIEVCWLMGKTVGRGLCSVQVQSWDPGAVNWDMWTVCRKRSWFSPGWVPRDRLPSPAVNDSKSFPSAGSILILAHSCAHFCRHGAVREWPGCSLVKDLALCISNLAGSKAIYAASIKKSLPKSHLGWHGYATNLVWPVLNTGTWS